MSTQFTFHSDPGHGWLEVPGSALSAIGLCPMDFTRCSYTGNGAVYLEEDCDAPKFLRVWEAQKGKAAIVEKNSNADSFIRRLAPNRVGKWQPFAA